MSSCSLILKVYGKEILINIFKELDSLFNIGQKMKFDDDEFIGRTKVKLY